MAAISKVNNFVIVIILFIISSNKMYYSYFIINPAFMQHFKSIDGSLYDKGVGLAKTTRASLKSKSGCLHELSAMHKKNVRRV